MNMDKKKLWISAVCLLMLAICYLAIHVFPVEVLALGWHALHGRTAHLKSAFGPRYDVDVPILTMASLDDGGWNVSLISRSRRSLDGNHRPRWGSMTLSVSPASSTAEETRKSAQTLREKAGYIITEVAQLTVAGQELYCFEQTSERRKLPTYAGDVITVNCLPPSDKPAFSATYVGSRTLLPQFYSVLSRVRRVN
jgi:hypothetical protein